jgi:hypothetical protein
MMLESSYHFHQPTWALVDLPDPRTVDSDPVRLAILASIVEQMVDAYNQRLNFRLGRGDRGSFINVEKRVKEPWNPVLERVPAWVHDIPPVSDDIDIDLCGTTAGCPHPDFTKRNIKAGPGRIMFI